MRIYETALRCGVNPSFGEQWQDDLAVAETHVRGLERVCLVLGVDPQRNTAGRRIVRESADVLIALMNDALATGDGSAAQLAACTCMVRMDAKDHEDWQWLEANDEALPALAVQALASRYCLIAEPSDAASEEEPLPPTVVRKTLLPPPSEHPGAEDARDVAVPKRSGTFPVANLPRPAKVPASGR